MPEDVIGQAGAVFDRQAERIPLLCVVGPTASGKSRLAVELARRMGGEVISCDSMQVYRRMDIGTAKPTPAEMDGIPHHMIDVVDPEVPYSCAEYVAAAKQVIGEVRARAKLPVICGGTGLYLDRLLHGGNDTTAASSPAIRAELEDYRLRHGNAALHRLLEQTDPESAAAIHENNVPRVIRALEIFRVTGKTKTEIDRLCAAPDPAYCPYVVGLSWDREVLGRRIDARVDAMMAAGLPEETRRLGRGRGVRPERDRGAGNRLQGAAPVAGGRGIPCRGNRPSQACHPPLRQATDDLVPRQALCHLDEFGCN